VSSSGRSSPADGDERDILLGWLAFHRDAFLAKCEGLTANQLVRRSADPSRRSLLGLVRHMAEMERAYGSWPLGEDPEFRWVWGDYEDGAEDDFDCTVDDADLSYLKCMDERFKTDGTLAGCVDLVRPFTLLKVPSIRWNLGQTRWGVRPPQWSCRHHPRTDRGPNRRMTRSRWFPSDRGIHHHQGHPASSLGDQGV
jgi:hypothetical protein